MEQWKWSENPVWIYYNRWWMTCKCKIGIYRTTFSKPMYVHIIYLHSVGLSV